MNTSLLEKLTKECRSVEQGSIFACKAEYIEFCKELAQTLDQRLEKIEEPDSNKINRIIKDELFMLIHHSKYDKQLVAAFLLELL